MDVVRKMITGARSEVMTVIIYLIIEQFYEDVLALYLLCESYAYS